MSVSVLEELVQSENKRPNLVSEFIPLENSGEIQSLQLTAFFNVCLPCFACGPRLVF
ncbi:hypothetical protein NQ317_002550 [Molorchus minor]|uniref:Uncharacterized protein n=1 Tax=Molorchus minor TaxID=1323400 RepID=A0ABQ9JST2_9CUCU|nr:hypothetical protein NQ317_002550 [Molorchus minor]